jgi:hypothetical protein
VRNLPRKLWSRCRFGRCRFGWPHLLPLAHSTCSLLLTCFPAPLASLACLPLACHLLEIIHGDFYENSSWLNTFYVKFGNLFPGMRSIAAAIDGRDPWTLKQLSAFDRVLSANSGVLDMAGVIMTAGGVFNFFTAPCRGGWIFGVCFVDDTKVLVARLPQGSTIAMTGAAGDDPDDMSLGALWVLVGVGVAMAASITKNGAPVEPKRRRQLRSHRMIDDLFSRGEPLNLLDDHVSEDSPHRRAAGRQPSEDVAEVFKPNSASQTVPTKQCQPNSSKPNRV